MLTPEDRALIDHFREAAEGVSPEIAAEAVPGVSSATLRRYIEGEIPSRMTTGVRQGLRKFLKDRAKVEVQEPTENHGETFRLAEQAALHRARALEKTAEAARLEAEAARLRAAAMVEQGAALKTESVRAAAQTPSGPSHMAFPFIGDQAEAIQRILADWWASEKMKQGEVQNPPTVAPPSQGAG